MQNVPIRIYWTNTVNETERNNPSSYDGVAGRLIHIGNDGRLRNAASVPNVPVSSGFTGMYLALIDEGTCVHINRLVVSYTVCPAQNHSLIIYPQTVAPTINNIADKLVPASCTEGASLTEATSLVCSIGGLWGEVSSTVCQCDSGYQLMGTGLNATCEGTLFIHFFSTNDSLPPNYFKPCHGNTEICSSCPKFSLSGREC